MDIQLQELLDKIRREGLEAAQTESAKLHASAEAKAKAIVAEAEAEAARIVEKAKTDAQRFEASGKAALSQASRDLLLAFKDRLQALLDGLVKTETAGAYGPEVLAAAIPAVLKALAEGQGDQLSLLLPPAELAKLEGRFKTLLAAELKKGLEIKPHAGLSAGFRVSEKSGAAYYDFSAEALSELLSVHVNAKLGEILRDAAKGM